LRSPAAARGSLTTARAGEAEETADLCRAANAVVKVVQADGAMTRIAAGWVKGTGQEGADRLREVVESGVPLRVASTPRTSPKS